MSLSRKLVVALACTGLIVFAFLVVTAVVLASNDIVSETTSTSVTGSTTSSSTVVPPTATPAQRSLPTTPVELGALRIDDSRPKPGYARDLFPTWLDLDDNGCNTRHDVLVAESAVPVTKTGRCTVAAGQWKSLYDGLVVTDAAQLDIDHMVPLSNAWTSGANTWEGNRRAAFANDTTHADALIAVTASSNRSKGDSPPNEWRPPDRGSWCRYASAWVEVKVSWGLTATTAERDALGQMLETCPR